MKKATMVVNKLFTKGTIDKRIYGSFVEHMGRVVYSGIYEPEHPTADENGFRMDVLDKVKELGVTSIRYPGGNFVSCYHWMDGVGPIENRPKRLEIAWRSLEPNHFGTNEFMKWLSKTEAVPIFAVNLGTRGIENAVSLLEYCNHPKDSYYSDLRVLHGYEEPYHIRTWCLGNEMDGDWQIGHKDAHDYGKLARETAKAMKQVDQTIELVSCGSSKSDMDTYPDWEAITLDYTYNYVDYISLHQYYGGQEKGTAYFLAQSINMEKYIQTVISVCDYMKAKKRSEKELYISFDEWGVWSLSSEMVEEQVNQNDWQIAPNLSEQIYTMEDTLLFSSMLLNFLRYSARIKIACQSLLTNISATIMTEKGGEVWVQPIFYPFAYTSKYGRGIVLDSKLDCERYDCQEFKQVSYLDAVTVYNKERKEIVYFIVSRCETEVINFECVVEGFQAKRMIEHVVLECTDLKATNQNNHELIQPYNKEVSDIVDNQIKVSIHPVSWNMIRVEVQE